MSSSCSSSGIAWAIARARAKSASASPNGRAATSRARNRGAPSNSGASAAAQAASSSPSSASTDIEPVTRSRAPVRREPVRRDQQRDVVAARGSATRISTVIDEKKSPPRSNSSAYAAASSAVGPRRSRDAAVGVGHGLDDERRRAVVGAPGATGGRSRPPAAGRVPVSSTCVEIVGRSVATGYPPLMSDLSIRVGDLHFSARWEPDAPQTIEAIRAMLPLRAKLIHCRWSGESTWIPYGDLRPDVGWEHHTSHPAPGPARPVSGRHQRVRDLLPVRRLHDGLEGRPAGRQPLRVGAARGRLGRSAARGRPTLPVGGRAGHRDRRARLRPGR